MPMRVSRTQRTMPFVPRRHRSGSRARSWLLGGLAALALLLTGPGPVAAQVELRAEVDRSRMSTDDQLLLSLIVEGDFQNASPPALPDFEGFDVMGTSSRYETSIFNGRRSVEARFLYQLRPRNLGRLEIPPIEVTVDGQSLSTQVIEVEVEPGSIPTEAPADADIGAGAGDRDLWVEASVSHPEPYEGQVFGYTFRFLQTYRLGLRSSYEAPSFRGFLSEPPSQRIYRTRVGGRTVRIIELQHLLYATQAGAREIEPAVFRIPGALGRTPMVFETEPVALTVRPLPEGAPQGFDGTVGRFEIAVQHQDEAEVGAPLRALVRVQGEGNLLSVVEPIWPELPPGWQSFAGDESAQTQVDGLQMSGSRDFERFLVPSEPGEVELPPLRLVYFDPERERYEVATSQPLRVNVQPAAGAGAAADGSPAVPPLLVQPASSLQPAGQLERRLHWTLLALLPALLLLFDRGLQRRLRKRRELAAEEAARPIAIARQRLRSAEAEPDPNTRIRLAERALRDYLEARVPPGPDRSGPEINARTEAASSGQMRESSTLRARSMLESLARLRFAPTSDARLEGERTSILDQAPSLREIADLIEEMEGSRTR